MRQGELRWRCRRGMRELDLPLQRYLEQTFESTDLSMQAAFVRLLDETDDALWRYLYGDVSPKDPALAELLRVIRRTAASHY